jgi:hypothetical protein
MMKFRLVLLLAAALTHKSEGAVRVLQQEDAHVEDHHTARLVRDSRAERHAQESWFGTETTATHIGVPLPTPSERFRSNDNEATVPGSWTYYNDQPELEALTIHTMETTQSPRDENDEAPSHKAPPSHKVGSWGSEEPKLPSKGKGSSTKSGSGSGSGSMTTAKGNDGSANRSKGNGKETKSPKGSSSSKSSKKKQGPPHEQSKKSSSKRMDKISKGKWIPTPPVKPVSPSGPPMHQPPTRMPKPGECRSLETKSLLRQVPQAIAMNPSRCCNFDGPVFAIITHAQPDTDSGSGFESFWNSIYYEIEAASKKTNTCFFMTGIDLSNGRGSTVSEIFINVNQIISEMDSVPSMMTTDPTDSIHLLSTVRSISNNPDMPSIGIFNSGYENVIVESLRSDDLRLPYIGSTSEQIYGQKGASATLNLLDNVPPAPLCLVPQNSLNTRCHTFYSNLGLSLSEEKSLDGLHCNLRTTGDDILSYVIENDANSVWAHQECCEAAMIAADTARRLGRMTVIGCMDVSPRDFQVDFVTTQSITLQAHAVHAWASFPVIQEMKGRDGRQSEYFPSLRSLINIVIHNIMEV